MTTQHGLGLAPIAATTGPLPDGVQVWHLDLGSAGRLRDWAKDRLQDDEIRRFARLLPAGATDRRCLCRAVLRELLGRSLGIAPGSVALIEGPQGKPALAPPHEALALHFNLSHSGEGALFALSWRGPVGVDLETLDARRNLVGMARVAFTAPECAEVSALRGPAQVARFGAIWCAKEATMKADGRGLSMGLASFVVDSSDDRPTLRPRPTDDVKADSNESPWLRWQLWRLVAPAGYCAALALPMELLADRRGLDGRLHNEAAMGLDLPC